MVITDKNKTVQFLLDTIPSLQKRWKDNRDGIFFPLIEEYRHHCFEKVEHDISFRDSGYVCEEKLNIFFPHFSLMKYELEALEMPLYASCVFPNANIDLCYMDSRNRLGNGSTWYLASAHEGKITVPRAKESFLNYYDLIVTRSATLQRMKSWMPGAYHNSGYKVNIQTNNYSPNFGLGEDSFLCYTDFFAPAGRAFSDRAENFMNEENFEKVDNLIIMPGSIVWWKGQLEWLQKVDPRLLRDKVVVLFGDVSDQVYYQKIMAEATRKNINLLHSTYVNPKFLVDVLCCSKIVVMNHYPDPPMQPIIGPARTFGEATICRNICLMGQTSMPNSKIGKSSFVPLEWSEYTIEYDQTTPQGVNSSLVQAMSSDISQLNFEKQISMEEKCDEIFEASIANMKKHANEDSS